RSPGSPRALAKAAPTSGRAPARDATSLRSSRRTAFRSRAARQLRHVLEGLYAPNPQSPSATQREAVLLFRTTQACDPRDEARAPLGDRKAVLVKFEWPRDEPCGNPASRLVR